MRCISLGAFHCQCAYHSTFPNLGLAIFFRCGAYQSTRCISFGAFHCRRISFYVSKFRTCNFFQVRCISVYETHIIGRISLQAHITARISFFIHINQKECIIYTYRFFCLEFPALEVEAPLPLEVPDVSFLVPGG